MNKIKFSHRYYKMPTSEDLRTYGTYLIDVWKLNRKELSPTFIDYDTTYLGGAYPLPTGELLVLMLKTGERLWTTVRRYIPAKYDWYKSLIGQQLEIELLFLNQKTGRI